MKASAAKNKPALAEGKMRNNNGKQAAYGGEKQ